MSDSLHPTRPATPRSTSRSQPGSAPRPTPGTLLFPALFALTLLLSLACASGGNGDAREGETNEERRARVAQQEASRMESPSRPLSSYADFELVPATMSDMVTAEEAKVAYVDKLEGMLVEKLGPLFADWERKGMGEGTLQIRPDVQNLKIVSGSARFWGGAMAVHAFAERKPLNLVLFYAYSVVMGLLVAPIALYAAETSPDVLLEAAVTTVVVFSALTGYVFFTKKDFSFLRGTLTVMFFVLLLGPLLGMLFGFDLTLLFSIGIVLFFVLYILYDTSAILRRYPTTMHVSAACVLFAAAAAAAAGVLFAPA